MAGVAAVMVAPEDRGRGVGRRLMTALLDEMAARGYPLSALYPATMPLYRSLGWELAGLRETAVIPARSLRDPAPPDPVIPAAGPDVTAGSARLRRAAPGDAEAVIAVIGRVHQGARDCGPITWDAASVARSLADPDLYTYLCDDGVLSYRWHSGNHDALFVERAEATSASAQRAFWAHVGSHASIADQVYARVGPADVFWLADPGARRGRAPPLDVDAPGGRRPGRHRRARLPRRRVPHRAAGHQRRRPAGQLRALGAQRHRRPGRVGPANPAGRPRGPAAHPGGARPGRAVRGNPGQHAAPGGPGRRRLARGRRRPGHGVRRNRLHARCLLKGNSRNTPSRCATGPPRAGRFVTNRCSWTSRAEWSTSWA